MKNLFYILSAAIVFAGCAKNENAETIVAVEDVENVAVEDANAPAKLSAAVPEGWTEDLAQAKELAKNMKKKILVAFSGSDWCGWCVRLDKEVYSTKEFFDLAVDKYVLVLIDCPRDPNRLSDFAKANNSKLPDEFNVSGFPCGVILDSDGVELGRIKGYVNGGPKAYFERMETTRLGPIAE